MHANCTGISVAKIHIPKLFLQDNDGIQPENHGQIICLPAKFCESAKNFPLRDTT